MLRFVALGSGSEGNALLVEVRSDGVCTRVLLDCGFGVRETVARLSAVGVDAASVDAVLVTHEHSDHVGGAYKLARRFGMPVYMSHGTRHASQHLANQIQVLQLCGHTPLTIGNVQVTPHPVPHDAREPLQFTFSDGVSKLAVLTDLGCATSHVVRMLEGADVIVLECNHDSDMLQASAYPESLKARIRGAFGHLSNAQAAALLGSVTTAGRAQLFAAHLSRRNNHPDLARQALGRALNRSPEKIGILAQDQPGDWIEVGSAIGAA